MTPRPWRMNHQEPPHNFRAKSVQHPSPHIDFSPPPLVLAEWRFEERDWQAVDRQWMNKHWQAAIGDLAHMGSKHPSPNVKTFCNFEPQIWLEIITSRDAKSACFQGSKTSCREIIFGIFWPNFREGGNRDLVMGF